MPDVLGTVQDLIASKGTQFFLSAEIPVLTGVEADDVALYDALNWTEVGMIESIGEFGPDGTIGSFTPLGTGVACKFRGNTDYGELSLVVAKTLTDTGLLALIARQGNPAEASFKVALSEAGTAGAGMEPHRPHRRGHGGAGLGRLRPELGDLPEAGPAGAEGAVAGRRLLPPARPDGGDAVGHGLQPR